MIRILTFIAALMLLSAPAHALSPTRTFEKALRAYHAGNELTYRKLTTERSQAWVTRIEQYPLQKALPPNIQVVDEKMSGDRATLRVSTPLKDGRALEGNVILHREEGDWKLDLPDSFQEAMGPRWEDTLLMTEKMLAAMRAQMPPEQYQAFQDKTIEQLRQSFTDRPAKK